MNFGPAGAMLVGRGRSAAHLRPEPGHSFMASRDDHRADRIPDLTAAADGPSLDRLLQAASAGGTVILTFGNLACLPILENRRATMARLGIDNILVVARDERTWRSLRVRRIDTSMRRRRADAVCAAMSNRASGFLGACGVNCSF
jgi:hypothetical protein